MDSATAHINRIRASKALAAYSVVIPTRNALARAPWLRAGPPVRARCGSLDLRSHFDGAYVPWCLRIPVYYAKEKPLVPGSHGSLLLPFLFFPPPSSLPFSSPLFPSSPFLPFSVSSIKLSPAPKICPGNTRSTVSLNGRKPHHLRHYLWSPGCSHSGCVELWAERGTG